MRPHQKLDLWKKAIEFVVAIYKVTEGFPKDEKFGLTSQLRRAAVSIVANIAEGAARRSSKEFRQFLSHSQGSASEVDTELIIAHRLGYLTSGDYERLADDLDHIGRMLTRLSQSLA
ncbi:MAG TPA: four helix bundle protein [Pyrinomonadaceae bacterium]|jgi:four helix bundle protein|nr:four helix bundle protein [Pyrinomonadaceae bacterium]